MFGIYFYLIGVCNTITLIGTIALIIGTFCTLMFCIGDIESGRTFKEVWDTFLKKAIFVLAILIAILIFVPSEDTIKAMLFDKVVVENVDVIKENAQGIVDYTIGKIKDLK